MKTILATLVLVILTATAFAEIRSGRSRPQGRSKSLGSFSTNPYRSNPYRADSLSNPFGAGSPYRSNGLMNPYSKYGSRYSNSSWRNPYATNAPKLYQNNKYRGRWSANRFQHDSTSNSYGRYGSPYSPDSLRNPYGAGSPYMSRSLYVYPGD